MGSLVVGYGPPIPGQVALHGAIEEVIMYARAVTIQLHPDKLAEAGKIMETVAEELQGQDGFHEITLLADETSGHGHLISLWESEAAIQATAPTIFKNAMGRLAPLFAAPPRPELLKVIMHAHRGE